VSAEKPYDATPAKREKAKREGNAARSSEIGVVAAFAAALAGVWGVAPFVASAAREAFVGAARRTSDLHAALVVVALACVPLVLAALVGSAASLAQSGGVHLRAVTFAPKHLAPQSGLKRMLGGEALVGAVRGTCAFVAALAVAGLALRDVLAPAMRGGSLDALAALVGAAAERIAAGVLLVGLAFAAVDYALARKRWLHGLKMSHDELKRDVREHDGDPHAKSRRKTFHRALVRGSLQRVREAAFVVVNPTHVAVALAYDPPRIGVPLVLVRAADEGAAQVRALAREHGVPLVENVGLARALYAEGEVDRPIPQAHYFATAHVVAELARAGVLA
jgi:flagellar biosynthesis protein FlhB